MGRRIKGVDLRHQIHLIPGPVRALKGGAMCVRLGEPAAKGGDIAGVKGDAIELDHPLGSLTSDPFFPWAGHEIFRPSRLVRRPAWLRRI